VMQASFRRRSKRFKFGNRLPVRVGRCCSSGSGCRVNQRIQNRWFGRRPIDTRQITQRITAAFFNRKLGWRKPVCLSNPPTSQSRQTSQDKRVDHWTSRQRQRTFGACFIRRLLRRRRTDVNARSLFDRRSKTDPASDR